jgi:hypothetical protein
MKKSLSAKCFFFFEDILMPLKVIKSCPKQAKTYKTKEKRRTIVCSSQLF